MSRRIERIAELSVGAVPEVLFTVAPGEKWTLRQVTLVNVGAAACDVALLLGALRFLNETGIPVGGGRSLTFNLPFYGGEIVNADADSVATPNLHVFAAAIVQRPD